VCRSGWFGRSAPPLRGHLPRQTPGPPQHRNGLRQSGMLRTLPAAHAGDPFLRPRRRTRSALRRTPTGMLGLRPGTCNRGLSPCSPPACPRSCKLTQPGATARVKVAALPALRAPLQRRHPAAFSRLPQGRRRRTARGQGTIPSSQRRTAGMPASTRERPSPPGQPSEVSEPAREDDTPRRRGEKGAGCRERAIIAPGCRQDGRSAAGWPAGSSCAGVSSGR